MDAATILQTNIPGFSGYSDENDRRRTDEDVRAYVGEALATLQARLQTAPPDETRLFGELLLRAEFRNQIAFKSYEYAPLEDALAAQVVENDARLVELARRASALEPDGLQAYLLELKAAFDQRDRTMQSVPAL